MVRETRKLQNAMRALIQGRMQITSGLCMWEGDIFLTAKLSYTLSSLLASQISPRTFFSTSSAEMLLLSIV